MSTTLPLEPARAEERALAERLAARCPIAEAELARRYRPGLIALLRHRTGDVCRAEDLCQETLRIALENLRAGALRDPASLAAYLWGIAANLARREQRGAWRRVALERGADAVDPADGPHERLLAAERARLVRELLAGLPPRDREVLIAFYIRGHEKRAICGRLSLSPPQFDVIKFRALRRFRRLWEARNKTRDRSARPLAQPE